MDDSYERSMTTPLYDSVRVDGTPQCVWCGEDLTLPNPDPEYCTSCGLPTEEDS